MVIFTHVPGNISPVGQLITSGHPNVGYVPNLSTRRVVGEAVAMKMKKCVTIIVPPTDYRCLGDSDIFWQRAPITLGNCALHCAAYLFNIICASIKA